MPTRIRLNNPAPVFNGIPDAFGLEPIPTANGFNTIKSKLDRQGARQILTDLRAQLDNGRGGVKSGYLKIVNTTQAGDHMQIVRKGRLHAWFSSGRMRRSNEALLTILQRSELASPGQLAKLRTYLERNQKAGTQTIAQLLQTLPPMDEGGPIGHFARSSVDPSRAKQLDDALNAAGLSLSPLARESLLQSMQSKSTANAFGAALASVRLEHPEAAPAAMGRFVHSWIKSRESAQPPDAIPLARIPAEPWPVVSNDVLAYQPCTVSQQAEYLLEAFKGSENRMVDHLNLILALGADPSQRDRHAGLVPELTARLRVATGDPRADALRQLAADELQRSLASVEFRAADIGAGDPPQMSADFLQRARAFHDQHGYLKAHFSQPAAGDANEGGDLSLAARARSALAIEAARNGWSITGAALDFNMGEGRALGVEATNLFASGALVSLNASAGDRVSLAGSSFTQSAVVLETPSKLTLNHVNFDGSFLLIRATGTRSWALSGLGSCSLEGAAINIDYTDISVRLRNLSPDQRHEQIKALYLPSPGRHGRTRPPITPILETIRSIPERYAAIKVQLVLDFLAHLDAVQASPLTQLELLVSLLRASPDLMRVPAIADAFSRSSGRVIGVTWENGFTDDFRELVRDLNRLGEVPEAMAVIQADPNFKHMQAMTAAAARPRELSVEERDAFVEAFLAVRKPARDAFISQHSGAVVVLLNPRRGEPALTSDGGTRFVPEVNPKLKEAHEKLIKHSDVRAALTSRAQGVDYAFDHNTPEAEVDDILALYSTEIGVILSNDQRAVCVTGQAFRDFLDGRPINEYIDLEEMPVFVVDRRPDHAAAAGQGHFNASAEQTGGVRRFNRLADASIDPLLRAAVVTPGQNVISVNLEHYFPASAELRELFRSVPTLDGRRLPVRLSPEQRAAVEAALGSLVEGGADRLKGADWPGLKLTQAHLDALREGLCKLGIPDSDSNFSAYLFQLSAVFTRFSSVNAFGREDEAFFAVRAYAHALLNHARTVAEPLPEADRRIPRNDYLQQMSIWLSSPDCAAIVSAQMLAASYAKAPELFGLTAPEGWRHLGINNQARPLNGVSP